MATTDTEARHAIKKNHSKRQSRRWDNTAPAIASSTWAPNRGPDRHSIVAAADDNDMDDVSPLDPRRFTPTLHASLVSEILSLRREVESRSMAIGDLEQVLHESQILNERLDGNLAQSSRELRSLKHQIQLLEGGSSSALSDLTRERDEAVESVSDVRRKLESAQKKTRALETELKSYQAVSNHEKESWQRERRNLERKVHIVEGRLKTVLDEVAAHQDAAAAAAGQDKEGECERSANRLSIDDSDDERKHDSGRKSVMSVEVNNENSGLSLAEELELEDEEGELEAEEEEEDPPTPLSPMSAAPLEERTTSVTSTREQERSPEYRDAGIQFSLPAALPGGITTRDSGTMTFGVRMVSIPCQTVEIQPVRGDVGAPSVAMVTASTQTDPTEGQIDLPIPVPTIKIDPPHSEAASARNSVVLPPQTCSVSCQANIEKKIPESRSAGMQTEKIQPIRRPKPLSLLPSAIPDPALDESTTTAGKDKSGGKRSSTTAKEKASDRVQAYPRSNDNGPLSANGINGKSGILRPMRSSSLFAGFEQLSDGEASGAEDTDVFTDDDMFTRPSRQHQQKQQRGGQGDKLLRRDGPASDSRNSNDEHTGTGPGSTVIRGDDPSKVKARKERHRPTSKDVNMRRTAMISNGAATHQRMGALSSPSSDGSSVAPPFPVPVRFSSRNQITWKDGAAGGRAGAQSPTPSKPRNKALSPRKPSLVRRPAVKQSRNPKYHGYSAEANVLSSPSSPRPPEDPLVLPRLPLDDINNMRQPRGKPPVSIKSSAAAVPAPLALEPYHAVDHMPRNDSPTVGTMDPLSTPVHPTSVVDAIAQTMVGEWMFKYVRRRRSFGVNESRENWDGRHKADAGGSGGRHRRWVWLAPYERSIMWSSKQPTSSPALLGKSGRKCEEPYPHYTLHMYMLTTNSPDQNRAGCQGREPAAQRIQSAQSIQSVDFNPDPTASLEVHGRDQRAPLCLAHGSLLPERCIHGDA